MVLTAIYDFAVSPPSYDFVYFLAITRVVKHRINADSVHVVFVPADTETKFRIDGKPIAEDEKIWRRDNLLVPMCRLIDATYTVCQTREDARKYVTGSYWPQPYSLEKPTAAYFYKLLKNAAGDEPMAAFHVDPWAKYLVTNWVGTDKYITITQRRAPYGEDRNSNTSAWLQFRVWAENRGWKVINIPDTEDAGIFPQQPLGATAAVNPIVRHAVYAGAAMNLGVNTGPMALCHCGALPYLTLKMVADYYSTTPRFFDMIGLPVGSQHGWASGKQKLIWDDDDFETIKDAFEKWA